MNNQVIVSNLKRLRHAKGFSQMDLAEDAGLTRGVYRNLEDGKTEPSVSRLAAIAKVLDVPLEELLRSVPELQDVRFRSNKALRTRSQILADVQRWLANYNALEDILDAHRPFVLDGVADALPVGENRPVAAARAVRAALDLTDYEPIRDICGLLDKAGVKVYPTSVASDHFFGLSVGKAGGGPAVVVNTWERISVERWIFTAAHELGHLILHSNDYGHEQKEEDPAKEKEADAFASEFLMPDAVFWREWQETSGLPLVDRVMKVKRIFRVSYRTVLYRYAPKYTGWGNIWVRFNTDYKNKHNRSLRDVGEPDAVSDDVFYVEAPVARRAQEPDNLSASDFREDRLARLVRQAVDSGEISLGRGAEILELSLQEMRVYAASWVG